MNFTFFYSFIHMIKGNKCYSFVGLQIASLKAALVRKDGESGHIQRSKSASCPETPGMMSLSPSFSNLANLSANRLPTEDVGNIEV